MTQNIKAHFDSKGIAPMNRCSCWWSRNCVHLELPQPAAMSEGLAKVYAILGQRFDSGHADTGARHNGHKS